MNDFMRWIKMAAVVLALAGAPVALGGCSRMYYNWMETWGQEKRDILVNRVEKARDSQEDAKEQFQSALDRFRSIVAMEDSNLAGKYEKLNTDFERSEARAQEVRERIDSIEEVSEDLFREWEQELEQYTSPRLRADSERKLRETRVQADQLIRTMRQAEQKMYPILDAFRDQVLYLKHNLNAQAIASLQGEVNILEQDIATLIEEMNQSIAEANDFISRMGQPG
ncbi:MAG: DUF2959 domain-containing protein [Sumerlaeia bacterium]